MARTLNFLQGLHFLLLPGVLLLFLELVPVLPVIEYTAHGRRSLRGNFHEVKLTFLRQMDTFSSGNNSHFNAVLVDEQDFAGCNLPVDSGISVFFSCYYSLSPPYGI